MNTGRITSVMVSFSRSAFTMPRIAAHVSACRGSASISIISPNHHDEGTPRSKDEMTIGSGVSMKGKMGGEKVKGDSKGELRSEASNTELDGEDNAEMKVPKKRKTIAEMDEELKAKMEGREGAAGISYEGGKPVTDGFGRGVKSNMFRVI